MNDIHTLMATINAHLDATEAQLRQGLAPDLGGFDTSVQKLCQEIIAQPQTGRYANEMTVLSARLQQVKQLLADYQQQIARELKNLGAQQQAHHAYKQADATDGFGKNKNKGEA